MASKSPSDQLDVAVRQHGIHRAKGQMAQIPFGDAARVAEGAKGTGAAEAADERAALEGGALAKLFS